MVGVSYKMMSSYKGGQHTNGPDYGTLVAEHEAAGVRIEIQTSRRYGPHKSRQLAETLIELALAEIVSG